MELKKRINWDAPRNPLLLAQEINGEPKAGNRQYPFLELSWEQINQALTCEHLLNHAYIVEVDSNKRYVRDYRVGSLNQLSTTGEKIRELVEAVDKGWTVKVENLEHFSLDLFYKALESVPGMRSSFHLYIGQEGSASFGMHTDPDPVIVVCVQGTKTFRLAGYDPIKLERNDWLYIPANHPHEALSDEKSAIVSVGLHPWGDQTPSYFLPNL